MYVNIVILSFASPNCTYTKGSLQFYQPSPDGDPAKTKVTTGLLFTPPGATVKVGIAALKAARPGTKVLLSLGESAYTNFAALNVQCIKDLVEDFALDGELRPDRGTAPTSVGGPLADVEQCSTTRLAGV